MPLCAVLATILWWWPQQSFDIRYISGWALCLFTTYVCMETNSVQGIVRVRTRLMACVWIVLAACMAFLHPIEAPAVSAACMALSYYLLFRCYQLYDSTAWIFHSFLFLGIGSLFAAVFLPIGFLYYVYLIVFLRSLTWRGFWAGIVGLLTPYWCWGIWCVLMDKTDTMLEFLTSHFIWNPVSWQGVLDLPLAWQISAGMMVLLSLVGLFHYFHTRYNDKIRVRMFLYIYSTQTILLFIYLFLQPSEFQNTMALLIVSACQLIAHYFALTKSWISNAFFILSLLFCGVMAYFNLWIP